MFRVITMRGVVYLRPTAAEAMQEAAQRAGYEFWCVVESPDRSVVLVVMEDGLVNTYGTPDALRAFGVGHLAEAAA